MALSGIAQPILFEKILEAIDKGITTEQLRQDPLKYILSGKTKEIVVNRGGEGLKVSYAILKEMEKRGDELAKKIIEEDKFKYCSKNGDSRWCFLETEHQNYDRENPILIEILKEAKIKNIGGWKLHVYMVPVEPWAYQILTDDDIWRSEYVVGNIEFII